MLKLSMTDKAKHQTESEIKFTINRYGSVYEYSDELVSLIKGGGQYIKSVENDLVITEYNADRINENSLKVLLTRDGETVDVDFTSNPETISSQVAIGESGWYQYTYTIKSSNFKKDGVYKISLASAYDTDDVKGNESASVPDNSITEAGEEVLDAMSFVLANFGYGLFAKTKNKASIAALIASIAATIVMIFLAEYISLSFEIFRAYKDYGITFFDAIRATPEFLEEPEIASALAEELAIAYMLGFIASISNIVNIVKSRKRKNKQIR